VTFILDASAALSWIFERNDSEERIRSEAHLQRLAEDEAQVPELWHLEVLNALVIAQRRGVIDLSQATDFLDRLEALPIRTESRVVVGRKEQLFALARENSLTAYDAAYLDLAIRSQAPLATFDGRLAAAAERAGISRL